LDAVNAAAQRVEALGAEAEQLTKAQQNGMNNFGK
jgi:hypothetical protein